MRGIEREFRVRVDSRTVVADGVVSLVLSDPFGGDLPDWEPGSHVDQIGPGWTRHYSLCGDRADRRTWRIGILRQSPGREGSAYIHDSIAEGALLDIRGPRNNFRLEPASRYAFIAGGIGITPILPMVASVSAARQAWELHYGGRSQASMPFASEVASVHGAKAQLYPQDEVGLIDLQKVPGSPCEDTLIYCCGPEPLLRAVEGRCSTWPAGALHLERSSPTGAVRALVAGRVQRRAHPERTRSDNSGREVDPGGHRGRRHLHLLVLREGTCETVVLAREIDHRDDVLTPEEKLANNTIMVCISRAVGNRLVLNL